MGYTLGSLSGKKYRENATTLASFRTASHPQGAMVFFNRVLHQCESQARAGSSFGRKEGLGYSGQVRRSYPTAIVRKGHP